MRKSLYGTLILLICALLFLWKRPQAPVSHEALVEAEQDINEPTRPLAAATPIATNVKPALASQLAKKAPAVVMHVPGKTVTVGASEPVANEKQDAPKLRKFEVEDGVAVIDGDIVLGVPSNSARTGIAELPQMSLWPTREIPYFIQPSLPNPARVLEAMKYFAPTYVSFVPFSNQDDVLVFQEGTGTCKSYVGRTGGKQPLWIAPACGPHEIAHEIMHALGFTHEQNRFDRDRYIKLNRENIDPTKLANFEKMPEEFMQVSGLSEFSFDSIMIYPPTMFSVTGKPTMVPVAAGEQIAPHETLSNQDITRVNKVYGAR